MLFSDSNVEGLYVPNDAEKLDLSTFEGSREPRCKGYIIIATPGGFHSSFHSSLCSAHPVPFHPPFCLARLQTNSSSQPV